MTAMACRLFLAFLISLAACTVVAQPAMVQPGEPIDYQPFAPERWKEKGQSTRMTPWVGKNISFLTTSPDLDRKTMSVFLARLDQGWELYAKQIGRAPAPNRILRGKPIIAAVPDPSFTCGIGCGFMGTTGIEVGGFYSTDYGLVSKQPDTFPHYYFYEMGRNYWLFGEQLHSFATGFAVFMRYVCMDGLQIRDTDASTRKVIEQAESRLNDTNLTFLQAFTMTAGMSEKENRLRDLAPSDQPVMFASAMLRLRGEYGGDEWVTRFFRYLADCPRAGSDNTPDSGQAQGLNWLVAASCAARHDLTPLFTNRWRLPVGPKTQSALRAIDWKAENLSPKAILMSLPADELPLVFATRRPEFITPARRKANLLAKNWEDAGLSRPGGKTTKPSRRKCARQDTASGPCASTIPRRTTFVICRKSRSNPTRDTCCLDGSRRMRCRWWNRGVEWERTYRFSPARK
jgi:hypothetical protein